MIVENVQAFVKRKIPVRFGLVPTVNSPGAIAKLKVAHHLHDTYGLAALLNYLEEVSSRNPPNILLPLTLRSPCLERNSHPQIRLLINLQ